MDLQYVFVVVAVLAGLHCRADDVASFRGTQTSKKIYCGQHLSQTLSAVCKGNYNTLNKKPDIYNRRESRYVPETHREYPYRSKESATSLMTHFRSRRRRGVFNECCEKPCSHEELSSYCANPR